ncbi:MAG: hypothetical protein K1000chlam3_01533, partial [Chlamydiae bacterium]|nr:hypothetical protein [Chlamydiota bacterium]
YVVNDANQLVQAEGAIYTFDSKGNLATKSVGGRTWEFKHNNFNQLTSITLPDEMSVSFTYDLSGKRLSKKVEKDESSQILRYFYLGQTELGYMDTKGNIVELRIPSNPNQPERSPFIAFELRKETYVPIYDIQNNVACLVDPERRKTQESYRYSAFGEEEIYNHRNREIQRSSVGNPWRYRGNRIDEEVGLICIGHRYYDPETGKWISPDPMGDLDGPNLYVYCRNNPLTYVDYFGLASEKNKSPVDESYFYGEYELHCYCERHRDCKRGGNIATDPTLRAGFSIGSAMDLSLEVLSHPRVQGSLQAFAGLAEAGAGGLVTLGSGGLAAPIGWPVLAHGLDQFITGISTAITGSHSATVTEQLLQTTGMSSEWASFTNNVLSIGGTMGGTAIIRVSRTGAFSSPRLTSNNSQNLIITNTNETGAASVVGRRGWEISHPHYQNTTRHATTTIQNRLYSGHALDQMQNRGFVPSIVENTIKKGRVFSTKAGTIGYYDSANNVRVIVNPNNGKVVTVIPGAPK